MLSNGPEALRRLLCALAALALLPVPAVADSVDGDFFDED